jgi:hypothetical protein
MTWKILMTPVLLIAACPSEPAGAATVSSVTKDGITWSFSQPVTVGQFVNRDYKE